MKKESDQSTEEPKKHGLASLRPAVQALAKIGEILDKLDPDDRARVLAWVNDEYTGDRFKTEMSSVQDDH